METEEERTKALNKMTRREEFQHNIAAITAMKGLIFPSRRSKHFRDNNKMIHCLKCLMYIERRSYNRHMNTCDEKDKDAPRTLAIATLHQKDM